MTVQSMFAQPSGFIANNGAAPPNIPLKVGYRPRQKPDLSLRLDGWMLSPQTLRSIAADLDRQAAAGNSVYRLSAERRGKERGVSVQFARARWRAGVDANRRG